MAKKAAKAGSKKKALKDINVISASEALETEELTPQNEVAEAAPAPTEAQAYLAQMEAERGYILEWHKALAEYDLDFLRGYNGLLEAAYTNKRLLDPKTKEMLITAVLMAVRSQPDHIKTHLEMCKKLGVTAQEMLEVLEIVLPPAGVPTFMHSFDLWRQVFGAE